MTIPVEIWSRTNQPGNLSLCASQIEGQLEHYMKDSLDTGIQDQGICSNIKIKPFAVMKRYYHCPTGQSWNNSQKLCVGTGKDLFD